MKIGHLEKDVNVGDRVLFKYKDVDGRVFYDERTLKEISPSEDFVLLGFAWRFRSCIVEVLPPEPEEEPNLPWYRRLVRNWTP